MKRKNGCMGGEPTTASLDGKRDGIGRGSMGGYGLVIELHQARQAGGSGEADVVHGQPCRG